LLLLCIFLTEKNVKENKSYKTLLKIKIILNKNMDETKHFKGLCIGSGGILGLYYLGILDYYYEKGLLKNIKYYSGTSIGSIICLLLIIGYNPKDIIVYLCMNDVANLFKEVLPQQVLKNYGLFNITTLKQYVETMIISKIGYIPTLLDIFEKYDKFFYCTSYNITNEHTIYFSHKTHPTMLVSDAIMCSSSIPFLFSKMSVDKNIYIDGAIFDPLPVSILLNDIEHKDILTISHKHKKNDEEESILNYAGKIFFAILKTDKSDAVQTEFIEYETMTKPFDFSLENKIKIKMFLEGQRYVKKLNMIKEKID
jgi:predicted acylesterase/phospholipase RssA